jgi:WD40 repeat protein
MFCALALTNAVSGRIILVRPVADPVVAVAFTPDGRALLATAEKVVDAASGQELYSLKKDASPAVAVAFAPGGKLLAVGHADGIIRLLDVASGKEQRRWQGERVSSLLFSQDGKALATGYSRFG